MEHESFSDPAIAETMNRYFVNIKVDREERPDVDRVYMTFVQATTGSGGLPLSVLLTPHLQSFFRGASLPHADPYRDHRVRQGMVRNVGISAQRHGKAVH